MPWPDDSVDGMEPKQPAQSLLLKAHEAATLCGTSERTWRSWDLAGKIAVYDVSIAGRREVHFEPGKNDKRAFFDRQIDASKRAHFVYGVGVERFANPGYFQHG